MSQKKVQKFEKLEEFMDPAGGFKNYRTKLREHPAGKPCIPYVALCLRDLTYIRLGVEKVEREAGERGVILFCLLLLLLLLICFYFNLLFIFYFCFLFFSLYFQRWSPYIHR